MGKWQAPSPRIAAAIASLPSRSWLRAAAEECVAHGTPPADHALILRAIRDEPGTSRQVVALWLAGRCEADAPLRAELIRVAERCLQAPETRLPPIDPGPGVLGIVGACLAFWGTASAIVAGITLLVALWWQAASARDNVATGIAAAEALGGLGGCAELPALLAARRMATPPLSGACRDGIVRILRRTALRAYEQVPAEAANMVVKLLREQDEELLVAALDAIDAVGRPSAAPDVERLLTRSLLPITRETARRVLGTLEARRQASGLTRTLVQPAMGPVCADELLRPAGMADNDATLLVRPANQGRSGGDGAEA